jgi:hypothetical protein
MEIPTFVGGDVVPSAAANASALEVLRAEAQPSDSVHLTFSPSYERALKVRVGDEPPDDPLDVYWEWEADVPPELVVDDDPTRLPVEHLGISFDGRGYLLLLFNGLWGQRNDYWADTLDDACELAQRQYGVTRNIWRRTGGSFDQPLMRPLPP